MVSGSLSQLPGKTQYLFREFCLRHPELRDVCDVGQMLYWNWRWVWYVTAAMFLLNNTFIQVSSEILDRLLLIDECRDFTS